MNTKRGMRRSQARWMIALTLCGALLGVGASAQAQERPIGTVVGVPMWELDAFLRANAVPGSEPRGGLLPANDVTVLHIAPEFNSAIATVAVTRRGTGEAASSVYFPTFGNGEMSRIYRQINAEDDWSFPRLFGEGFTAVVKVNMTQSPTGTYTPGRTRFVILPTEYLNEIVASNPVGKIRIVHRQRAQIGGGNRAVVLAAIDGSSLLASGAATVQVPTVSYGQDLARLIRGLNSNVELQGLDTTGSGRATTIEVK